MIFCRASAILRGVITYLHRHAATLLLLVVLVACASPPTPTPTPERQRPEPTATIVAPGPSPLPAPTATAAPAATATPVAIDPLFDAQRISYAHGFNGPQIQALLEERGSPLKDVRFTIGDRSHTFSEVLVGLSSLYSLSPQLLLALIDLQSGLVSSSQASPEQLAWALGYRGDSGSRRGLYNQLRWAARELRYAVRDHALSGAEPPPELVFADGTTRPVEAGTSFSRYALSRVLARTVSPGLLGTRLEGLVNSYSRLFGDPRPAPLDWPAPAAPFLVRPMERLFPVTSFFDHETPFLQKNGAILTYWGRSETDLAFAYDGHTGWDFGMGPPDAILAAAAGEVIFAGNSDDGCATPARAVVVDHGNGYRTLYWHLASIAVTSGAQVRAGDLLGVAGDSGCAIGAHLHLQVQYLGRDVDPFGWCGAGSDPWQTSSAGQQSVWLWADMPNVCGPPQPGVIVVDDDDAGFLSNGTWSQGEVGYGGGARYAASSFGGSTARPYLASSLRTPLVATWRPELVQPGRYRVLAYVPYALNDLDESHEQRYLIRHRDGESLAVVDGEESRNWWAELGIFELDPATALVSLSTLAGDERRGIWADAVAFVPVP